MLALMVGLALSWSPLTLVVLRAEPQENTAAVDTVRTKDGRLHAGKILSETARGYLFRNEQSGDTYVIEFETIQDLSRASDKPVAPTAPPTPAPVLVPQPSATEQARAIARASELRTEIVQLRLELDDATLAGPIVKLTFSGIATVLTFVFLAVHVNTPLPRSGYPDTRGQMALAALIAGTVAVVNGVWGGLQLLIRLRAREELPKQIQTREAELMALESGGTVPSGSDSRR